MARKGRNIPAPQDNIAVPDARAGKSAKRGKAQEPLRVLVVRHAIAEDAGEFARSGAPDADRPLTSKGKQRMRESVKGLSRLEPKIGVIATSPLVRAVQTAELIAKHYAKNGRTTDLIRLSALAPGKSGTMLLGWLAEQERGETIVVVGHEPHLGQFVSWALTGLRESFVEVKKGAGILLEFADEVRPGRAKLLWAAKPKILRSIRAD